MTHLLLTGLLLFGQAPAEPPDPPDGADATATGPAAADAAPATPPAGDVSAEQYSSDGDDESAEAEKTEFQKFTESGALGLLLKGGLFMWPILLVGILAAGVIIERYRSLKMLSSDSSALREEVRELLHEDRVEEALTACDREQGPVPAILSAGLRKYLVLRRLGYDAGRTEEQVVKAMDDHGVHVVAALEKHLPILGTVSSAAPMLGFLGTVAGMVVSFEEIREGLGSANIVELAAGGISVALLTTAFGLIVGIPAFVAFNYFTGVINGFVLEVEETATELIEAVTLQLAVAHGTDHNHDPGHGAASTSTTAPSAALPNAP